MYFLHTHEHKCITQDLHNAQLIDIWRLHLSGERDYTFYSSPHKVYSRIDYFFVPHSQLETVHSVETGNITWSDHVPITMRYGLSFTLSIRSKFWRLNESLLQTPVVLTDVTNELKHYFHTNDTEYCDPGILWKAHKAVMRGVLIKHGAHIKREREQQLLQLLHKIHVVESKHKQTPVASLEVELLSLRASSRPAT